MLLALSTLFLAGFLSGPLQPLPPGSSCVGLSALGSSALALQEPVKPTVGAVAASAEGCWLEPCGEMRSCEEDASGPLPAGRRDADDPDDEDAVAKQSAAVSGGTAPAPGTLLLVGTALVGLVIASRRLRRHTQLRQPSRAY